MVGTDDESRALRAEVRFAVVPEWVLDAEVTANAVRLYAVLARYADRDGECFPSRRTLADRCRMSTATVDRAMAELRLLGAVEVHARLSEKGDPTSNLYMLRSSPVSPGACGQAGGVSSPVRVPLITGEERGVITGDDLTRTTLDENHLTPVAAGAGVAQDPETRARWEHAVRLASLLADLIAENGSKRPKVTQRWTEAIERLMRIDGRTPEQIERAIRWCQADDFWRGNILSAETLRRQYDRLRLAAAREREGKSVVDVDAVWAEVRAMMGRVGGARGRPLDDWSSPVVAEAVRRVGWRELCTADERVARRSLASHLQAVHAETRQRSS